MNKAFYVDQSPISEKFMVRFNDEVYAYFKNRYYCGYYPARVLGMNFADYCRFCRDEFGGTIYGKESYPYIQYDEKANAQKVCDLLNKYWAKGKKIL